MRLVITGAPGSGKGTQSALIAQRYGLPAVSTGDIFRRLHNSETPVAMEVRAIMADGGYVSDDITNRIVLERLARADCRHGFLLDGYPRTLHQVGTLDFLLAAENVGLDAVIALQVDEDEVTRRLLARAVTGGRIDDTEETVRVRQRIYRDRTEPLLHTYRRRSLLVEVDGLGEVDDVFARITAVLDNMGVVAA